MAKRQPISKKLRFEVFKRDSFTCQYCGLKAPDVILEVDHIKPVKEGGTNDLLNLITSCYICNRGKGAIDIGVDKYYKNDAETFNIMMNKLGGILILKNKPPHIQQIAYIKGICRNKFDYYDARKTSIMLNNFYKDGGNLDELQELLVNDEFRNWASFRYFMEG